MATTITGSGVDNIVDGTITNADINASAAIAGSKVDGSFGKVLQVVFAENSTPLTLASTTYTDTGLSASITPVSTASKILVLWNVQASIDSANSGWGTQLVRDATNIYYSNTQYDTYSGGGTGLRQKSDYKHLDSPNTTSAVTYKVQVGSYSNLSIRFNNDSNQTQIVLMEIGS
jgi:hypothetical protein